MRDRESVRVGRTSLEMSINEPVARQAPPSLVCVCACQREKESCRENESEKEKERERPRDRGRERVRVFVKDIESVWVGRTSMHEPVARKAPTFLVCV